MLKSLTILILLTSQSVMPGAGKPTGVWLEEFTSPYYRFADAGAEITVASIQGGAVPIDPRSLGDEAASVARYREDAAAQALIAQSKPLAEVAAKDYDIVFLPGGHGTMWDLPESKQLGQLLVRTLDANRVVAAVCHGPAGLVAAIRANGEPLVKGRRVSAFSDSEEKAAGLTEVVPFLLESRLRELGAKVETGPDFKPFVVTDGKLVTGQNPASAEGVAEAALAAAR